MADFGPEHIIVVYRDTDSESLEFAERYQEIHGLADEQLVAVPCSSREVLDTYTDFQTEVENPLKSALSDSGSDLLDRTVYAFVLMPRVPGGFRANDEVISSTSRLSRLYSSFEPGLNNPLYDPKVFRRYQESDNDIAYICSRFDTPQAAITRNWFDNTQRAIDQLFVSGKFFMDSYAAIFASGAEQYEQELVSFETGFMNRLGIDTRTTVRVDPYVDPIIPKLDDDSFYWGWGTEEGSLTFFGTSTNIRGFFYNADFTGAETMRNIDARNWPLLAIRQGYVATAGAMSNMSIDAFLRPFPLFNALFRGARMGEAMLYAQPKFDTPMAMFGDPLLQYTFPLAVESTTFVDEDVAWMRAADCCAQSVITMFRKSNILMDMRNDFLSGDDVDVQLELSRLANRLGKTYEDPSWRNDYINLVRAFFDIVVQRNKTFYPAHYPTLNDYLDETDGVIPEIILDVLNDEIFKATISEEHLYEEGTWEFEFDLEHPNEEDFAFYQFELDISTDIDFDESDIVLSKRSEDSVRGWFRQNEDDVYEQMNINGVTSNFVGKNVKYVNQPGEKLERGKFYYFRIRQKDQLTTYDYRTFREVIYR
tara:strand:- start:75560 stop:77338 length:1779 start_codon:yes stop_codon:yes gene_type:complete